MRRFRCLTAKACHLILGEARRCTGKAWLRRALPQPLAGVSVRGDNGVMTSVAAIFGRLSALSRLPFRHKAIQSARLPRRRLAAVRSPAASRKPARFLLADGTAAVVSESAHRIQQALTYRSQHSVVDNADCTARLCCAGISWIVTICSVGVTHE